MIPILIFYYLILTAKGIFYDRKLWKDELVQANSEEEFFAMVKERM